MESQSLSGVPATLRGFPGVSQVHGPRRQVRVWARGTWRRPGDSPSGRRGSCGVAAFSERSLPPVGPEGRPLAGVGGRVRASDSREAEASGAEQAVGQGSPCAPSVLRDKYLFVHATPWWPRELLGPQTPPKLCQGPDPRCTKLAYPTWDTHRKAVQGSSRLFAAGARGVH